MKKRLSILALLLTLSTSLIIPNAQISYAESTASSQQSEVTNPDLNLGNIDLSNLSSLSNMGDGASVTLENGVVAKRVSYEEAVASIADLSGKTIDDVKATHQDKTVSSAKNAKIAAASSNVWLSEFTVPVPVNASYIPTLKVYAYIYHSGSFTQFNEMFEVQLNRTNTNNSIWAPGSKIFGGTASARIVNGSQILWIVNGDFYDKGTVTITGGLEAGAMLYNAVFNLSYSSNYYAYCYKDGYLYAY